MPIKRKRKRKRITDCYFCKTGVLPDYKEPDFLRRFTTETGKIKSRLRSQVCAKHQRRLAKEIKRARFLSLLPFVRRV